VLAGIQRELHVDEYRGGTEDDLNPVQLNLSPTTRLWDCDIRVGIGQPVISVDTKKKELVGDFKNGGREWRPQGDPTLVRTKDFKDKTLGKVNPYGVYDIALDEGWVSVGIDADTAEFAVASIASWWAHLGKARYPAPRR